MRCLVRLHHLRAWAIMQQIQIWFLHWLSPLSFLFIDIKPYKGLPLKLFHLFFSRLQFHLVCPWTLTRPTLLWSCWRALRGPTVARSPSPTPPTHSASTRWPRCCARRASSAAPATGRWSGRAAAGWTSASPTGASDAKAAGSPACWGATRTRGGWGARTPATPPGTTTARPRWPPRPAPASASSWSGRRGRCPSTACRTRWYCCTPSAARSPSRCTRPSAWTWTPPCSSAPTTEATGTPPHNSPSLPVPSQPWFQSCRKGLFQTCKVAGPGNDIRKHRPLFIPIRFSLPFSQPHFLSLSSSIV